jgi:hypothetical protein
MNRFKRAASAEGTPKRSKFNSKKVFAEGYKFDSDAEYKNYLRLKADEDVYDLEVHSAAMKYEITPYFKEPDGSYYLAETYTPDFRFKRYSVPDVTFVIDVKGAITRDFKLKWKLFRRMYPQLAAYLVDKKGALKHLYKPRKKKAVK